MPLVQDLSLSQLAFQVGGGDVDRFQVVRYHGSEGLCQLYRFEIDLVAPETGVALDEIVGKSAVLSINTLHGTRWFHGLISRFDLTEHAPGQTCYRATLVPMVWLLTQRYNCRIFQNKTTQEIINDVLTQAGIAVDRFKFMLQRQYEPREYRVQYRETDYNFICRLMEEEGIWWYFEQTQDAHMLTMADATSAYAPLEGDATLPFVPAAGLVNEEEHVFQFRLSQAVRPGAVVLNDFNFERPALKLEARSAAGHDSSLEFFDYPGEYAAQAAGRTLAEIRVQEFDAGRVLGMGRSTAHGLAPGRTFQLSEHPVVALNTDYLITAAVHQGKQAVARSTTTFHSRDTVLDARVHESLLTALRDENETTRQMAEALLQISARLQTGDPTAHPALTHWVYHAGQVSRDLASLAVAGGDGPSAALALSNLIEDVARIRPIDRDAPVYQCQFECIPATATYRPPRITPWPVMRGSQTARVVGPAGEEIHCDQYGRVKVQFNWDRAGKFDDHSSCWIRVSQGLAGGAYGMLFLPRVGQEVVVDFLEGNPDKPLIVGRVYNADQMPPYKLPDDKTKSVIKTHSSKGGGGTNEIRFEDLKDHEQILLHAQKDLHLRAENDRVEHVGHDLHLTVKENRIELVKKNHSCEVTLDQKEKIGGDRSDDVKGKVSIKVGGTHSLDVTGDVVEKFGANHKHEVTQTYACKGTSVKLEASAGIELKCGGSSIVLTPAAVFIVGGPLVQINTAAGPPVPPVAAQLTSPLAPDAPIAADDVKPGKDANYTGGAEAKPARGQTDEAGWAWEPTDEPEKKTSWIEIELVNEAGQPVPSEAYEITCPDGETVRQGSTDDLGRAHVGVPEPGVCRISFPHLDAAAWERKS